MGELTTVSPFHYCRLMGQEGTTEPLTNYRCVAINATRDLSFLIDLR